MIVMHNFRPVVGYEGRYLVSDLGQIFSCPKRTHGGMIMKPIKCANGYLQVNLMRCGKKKAIHIHRIVAAAWLPAIPDKPQINHKNCIKSDNRSSNLEWCTDSENRLHASANGLLNFNSEKFKTAMRENAKKAHAATRRLTYEQADEIRRLHKSGVKVAALAKLFPITFGSIYPLLRGETYVR